MTPTRERVLEEARKWMLTPFRHQGRLMTVGVDCIGLIIQPANDAGFQIPDVVNYPQQPTPQRTLKELSQRLVQVPVECADIMDVLFLWFEVSDQPHHFVWKTPIGILHAYEDAKRNGKRGLVVETRMPPSWNDRIHSVWRLPWEQ